MVYIQMPQSPYPRKPIAHNVKTGMFRSKRGAIIIIDNSRANTFRRCPYEYFEAYVLGVEPIPHFEEGYGSLEYGDRVHQLLEEHYKKVAMFSIHPPSSNEALEEEAQDMLREYQAHYPQEDFQTVDVEHNGLIQLPNSHHIYAFKRDLFGEQPGKFLTIDHKTEQRNSKSNLPQKWAADDQASLYIWAAQQQYGTDIPIEFWVNILTRRSPAGRVRPSFPERQKLERTQKQIEIAVRDIIYIADEIERMQTRFGDREPWPANRKNCYTWSYCDYYQPHTYGWSDDMLKHKFRPKEEYLQIEGIEVLKSPTAKLAVD